MNKFIYNARNGQKKYLLQILTHWANIILHIRLHWVEEKRESRESERVYIHNIHMCVHACKIRVRSKKWHVNKTIIYGKVYKAYNIIMLRYNRRELSEITPSRSKDKNDKEMISRLGIPCRESKTIARIRRAWLCRLYQRSAYHPLSCCTPLWQMDQSIELLWRKKENKRNIIYKYTYNK